MKSPSFLPGLEKIFVNRFLVDFKEKKFLVYAHYSGTLGIIPKYVKLDETRITVAYENKTFDFRVMTTVTIARVKFEASFSKKGSNYYLAGTAKTIKIGAILGSMGTLGKAFKSLGLSNFEIRHIRLDLSWNSDENSFTFTGYPSLTALERASMQLTVFNVTKAKKAGFFIGFEVYNGPLAPVVKSLSGIDIRGFPRLGQLTIPDTAIWVASKTVVFNEAVKLRTNISSFQNYKTVKRGISVNFELLISNGTLAPISLELRSHTIDAFLPHGLSLDNTLKFFSMKSTRTASYKFLRHHLEPVLETSVKRVAFSPKESKAVIKGRTKLSLRMFKGKIQLKHVDYQLSLHKLGMGVKIGGTMVLFNVQFKAEVGYESHESHESQLRIKLSTKENLKLINLLNTVSAKIAKNKFVKVLELDKFELNHPSVELIRTKGHFAFQ